MVIRSLQPAVRPLFVGPDEEDVLVGVDSLVLDAEKDHQLVGLPIVVGVNQTVGAVSVPPAGLFADDDGAAPVLSVGGLVENEAVRTLTVASGPPMEIIPASDLAQLRVPNLLVDP